MSGCVTPNPEISQTIGRLEGARDVVQDPKRFPRLNRDGLAELLDEAISALRSASSPRTPTDRERPSAAPERSTP